MTDGLTKLQRDLDIVEAMAAEMGAYLTSEVLFWPLKQGDMPRLTLGGYLMRQHRLLALAERLDTADRPRLYAAVSQFNETISERVVRFEERAHHELDARLRQWQEFLRELKDESAYYAASVETRAMIDALIDFLRVPPYRLDETIANRLGALDRTLRNRWAAGDFVWPQAWAAAYPRDEYWWLYGRPR